RRLPGVDQIPHRSALDQRDSLSGHTFAIARHSSLKGMIGVVPDGDVFTEELRTYAVAEKTPLIEDCLPAEIPHQESKQVQHGGWLQNHGVFARRHRDGI